MNANIVICVGINPKYGVSISFDLHTFIAHIGNRSTHSVHEVPLLQQILGQGHPHADEHWDWARLTVNQGTMRI
eukprot:4126999-Karenia_brevis.AAC.1